MCLEPGSSSVIDQEPTPSYLVGQCTDRVKRSFIVRVGVIVGTTSVLAGVIVIVVIAPCDSVVQSQLFLDRVIHCHVQLYNKQQHHTSTHNITYSVIGIFY